jgi:ribosome-associated protein
MSKTISEQELQTKQLIDTIIESAQDIKAKDITILDLTGIKQRVCDYFIICTGESSTQVDSIANSITKTTRKKLKEKPWHYEDSVNKEWILIDYVNIVVHVFYKETRGFYNIEGLWADAKRTDIPNLD